MKALFLLSMLVYFCIPPGLQAQTVSEISISATGLLDRGSVIDTLPEVLTFVNVAGATVCQDSISPTLVERECPPDAAWISWRSPFPPARCAGGWFFCNADIRGIPADPARKDTFFLTFGESPFFPNFTKFTLRWPGASFLAARCDSIRLHGVMSAAGIDLDMMQTDSLVINDAGPDFSYVAGLYIYKYGSHLVDVAADPPRGLPSAVALGHNYPNPANPTTFIPFEIPGDPNGQVHVRLEVFDILGRSVETLVNETKAAGSYAVSWDAGDRPSGTYFYRLTAGRVMQTGRLMVLR